MQTARIENWSLQTHMVGAYQAPETASSHLMGEIYDHPKFKDGTFISTSTVSKIDEETNTATTRNTIFTLGKMEKGFAEWRKENNKDGA